MKITDKSHLDHGLSARLVALIAEKYADRKAFFIDSFNIPEDEPPVSCALLDSVPEHLVFYRQRAGRKTWTRLCALPPRKSSIVTVIAGPSGDEPCVLYTAYGGPLAPREPGDADIRTAEDAAASFVFWRTHALSEQ
jgi:hypothetical protein